MNLVPVSTIGKVAAGGAVAVVATGAGIVGGATSLRQLYELEVGGSSYDKVGSVDGGDIYRPRPAFSPAAQLVGPVAGLAGGGGGYALLQRSGIVPATAAHALAFKTDLGRWAAVAGGLAAAGAGVGFAAGAVGMQQFWGDGTTRVTPAD